MCKFNAGQGQNPASLLFLYGPSGAGKTRLLQRIDEALDGVQGVMRRGCEQILDDMVQSLAERSFEDCFERFCSVDNLLLDNLWILRSRPASAAHIGRLIEARMSLGKLTVLASDLTSQEVVTTLPSIGQYLQHQSALHLAIATQPAHAKPQRKPSI